MKKPFFSLLRMTICIILVISVTVILWDKLLYAFSHNQVLNAFILVILVVGIAYNFFLIFLVFREASWLNQIQKPYQAGIEITPPPSRLTSMGQLWSHYLENEALKLSFTQSQIILDSIITRFRNNREPSRYISGLLIFLGLLGTFYGLLLTIGSISDVIRSLSTTINDANLAFNNFKDGLAEPLFGMGAAFSGSMFGLAGALIIGFLDLSVGQAQHQLINQVENWFFTITQPDDIGNPDSTKSIRYLKSLIQQTSDNIEALERLTRLHEERYQAQYNMLGETTEQLRRMSHLVQEMKDILQNNNESQAATNQLLRQIREEYAFHQQHIGNEIRKELRLLGKIFVTIPNETSKDSPT